MTRKINRIILIDFVISYNYLELYSSISRTSFKRIEKNMSLLKNLFIVKISIITNLNFIT